MTTNPFLTTTMIEIYTVEDDRFEIRECQPDGHRALFARTSFAPHQRLIGFGASEVHHRPDRYTVQTGPDRHIILKPLSLQYINHHCFPNTRFDCRTMQLRAVRPIEPGDELTFFYPSTEWSMDEPFNCHCGSSRCLGRIQGAAFLEPDVLAEYDLAPHIEARLATRQLSPVETR
ncbi:MAG: SET domain-containing protein-lysine N-methyltransferase [Acidobacteria bacterium]|nr:SET domain-containing protein-lysine N-methyltransferase [Acidobacteriota bacterium]